MATIGLDLHRTFVRSVSAAGDEAADGARQEDFSDYLTGGRVEWKDLIAKPLVVVLGETGSGKTWEFRDRVRRLSGDGKTAFFLSLNKVTSRVGTVVYAALYGWLPDVRQRLRTVLPGALVGALLWLAAAAILSYTLRSAGKLVLVYGGFAGLVATLVFLYVSAVTLIFGAEINAVLRDGGGWSKDGEAAGP